MLLQKCIKNINRKNIMYRSTTQNLIKHNLRYSNHTYTYENFINYFYVHNI